ncbi:uncharacterized protein SAPINGB_P003790 [Magnusiomyces paraingens]|uniref:MATH domain-containing protein n=1 Tax=Magnusiomyces paraingens TaxID=2606893 RepID=A0A5E8BWJ8_9ASCO|nr:uncharacterized protein SAPINGB_P003790 [Saprochaete ingens]VVT53867.1 unnamed protein product [Saprochaete ingens]
MYRIKSAHDFDSLEPILLPKITDPEISTSDQTVFQWEIDNWNQLSEKQHSPTFYLDGYAWKIQLYPKGIYNDNNVSIYVEADFKSDSREEESYDDDAIPPYYRERDLQLHRTISTASSSSKSLLYPNDSDDDSAICIQFGFVMWNPDEPSSCIYKASRRRLTRRSPNWGFSNFVTSDRLLGRNARWRPLLGARSRINISLFLRTVDDPTGILWNNLSNYNSRRETGYIGVIFPGSTNTKIPTLLQTLYAIPVFRSHIIDIVPAKTLPGVFRPLHTLLRSFFSNLETFHTQVICTEIAVAMGWTPQKAQMLTFEELQFELIESLEAELKNSDLEASYRRIFTGQTKTLIRSPHYENYKVDDYWELSFNVMGFSSLAESFKNFLQEEALTGDNQYLVPGLGRQDAVRAVKFQSLPLVLNIRLNRLFYDRVLQRVLVSRARYDYPEEMDLTPYLLHNPFHTSESFKYTLYGVVVTRNGEDETGDGDFFSVLKTGRDGPWLKFDGRYVSRTTRMEVFDRNFGPGTGPHVSDGTTLDVSLDGAVTGTLGGGGGVTGTGSGVSNLGTTEKPPLRYAATLVYYRTSMLNYIVGAENSSPMTPDNPHYVDPSREIARERRRIQRHLRQLRRGRRDSTATATNMGVVIRLATLEQFCSNSAMGIAVFPSKGLALECGQEEQKQEAYAERLVVSKQSTPGDLLDLLMSIYPGMKRAFVRLWSVTRHRRQGQTLLPPNSSNNSTNGTNNDPESRVYYTLGRPIRDRYDVTMEDLVPSHPNYLDSRELDIFLEYVSEATISESHFDAENVFKEQDSRRGTRILLFLKYFNPLTQRLKGISTYVVYSKDRLAVLFPVICKAMDWPANTPIRLGVEVGNNTTGWKALGLSELSFASQSITNGVVITFEREYSAAERAEIVEQIPSGGYLLAKEYYDFLNYRVLVIFRQKRRPRPRSLSTSTTSTSSTSSTSSATISLEQNHRNAAAGPVGPITPMHSESSIPVLTTMAPITPVTPTSTGIILVKDDMSDQEDQLNTFKSSVEEDIGDLVPPDVSHPDLPIWLHSQTTYESMCQRVSKLLDLSPKTEQVEFFKRSPFLAPIAISTDLQKTPLNDHDDCEYDEEDFEDDVVPVNTFDDFKDLKVEDFIVRGRKINVMYYEVLRKF